MNIITWIKDKYKYYFNTKVEVIYESVYFKDTKKCNVCTYSNLPDGNVVGVEYYICDICLYTKRVYKNRIKYYLLDLFMVDV